MLLLLGIGNFVVRPGRGPEEGMGVVLGNFSSAGGDGLVGGGNGLALGNF